MEKEVKRELVEKVAFWRRESKTGDVYYSGKSKDGQKYVGFINKNKKNPKEPDLRVYLSGDNKEEYVSLWCNTSKSNTKYLSGKKDGKQYLGFFNKADGNKPELKIYESLESKQPKTSEVVEESLELLDLPF